MNINDNVDWVCGPLRQKVKDKLIKESAVAVGEVTVATYIQAILLDRIADLLEKGTGNGRQ